MGVTVPVKDVEGVDGHDAESLSFGDEAVRPFNGRPKVCDEVRLLNEKDGAEKQEERTVNSPAIDVRRADSWGVHKLYSTVANSSDPRNSERLCSSPLYALGRKNMVVTPRYTTVYESLMIRLLTCFDNYQRLDIDRLHEQLYDPLEFHSVSSSDSQLHLPSMS